MPYDTDCSLVETNDGGADRVSFAVNGEDATSGGEGEGEETDSVLEFTTPDLDVELNRVADTNIEVTNTGTSADVSVTKAGSPATVAQGAPVSFTITVTNGSGGDAAEGVVLTDDLPAGLTWSLPEPVVDEPDGETPEGEAVGRRSRLKAKSSRKKSKQWSRRPRARSMRTPCGATSARSSPVGPSR